MPSDGADYGRGKAKELARQREAGLNPPVEVSDIRLTNRRRGNLPKPDAWECPNGHGTQPGYRRQCFTCLTRRPS